MEFSVKEHYTLADCAALIHFLRQPEGCPWDQEQTHESIRRNFIEEAYEVADAIDRDDPAGLCEELGDVLLQVLFHTDIAADNGRFTLEDVCDSLCRKMVTRHPHLFGDAAEAPDWETIKRAEKGQATRAEVLRAIPRAMPALWRADKLVSKSGLRYADAAQAQQAAQDTVGALDAERPAQTLGDALLALLAWGQAQDCDPEQALHEALARATDRFAALEQAGALDSAAPDTLWRA